MFTQAAGRRVGVMGFNFIMFIFVCLFVCLLGCVYIIVYFFIPNNILNYKCMEFNAASCCCSCSCGCQS